MSRLGIRSKLNGKLVTFEGEYVMSSIFHTDCGKVFEIRDGEVQLAASFAYWDGCEWVRRLSPDYFAYPVPIGSVG